MGTFAKHSFAIPGVDSNPNVVPCACASRPPLCPTVATKASAAQPHSPTWTAHDGYGSEATAVTATSRQSPIGTHRHQHASDAYSGPQPSSNRRVQQLTADSGRMPESLSGHRHHARGSTRPQATERLERKQEWDESWSLPGGGGVREAQVEGGASSGEGVRGGRNR